MPFKTKSRKIAALKHRVKIIESGFLTYSKADDKSKVDVVETKKNKEAVIASSAFDSVGVKNEMARIILLACVIIGLQIALKFSKIPLFR